MYLSKQENKQSCTIHFSSSIIFFKYLFSTNRKNICFHKLDIDIFKSKFWWITFFSIYITLSFLIFGIIWITEILRNKMGSSLRNNKQSLEERSCTSNEVTLKEIHINILYSWHQIFAVYLISCTSFKNRWKN